MLKRLSLFSVFLLLLSTLVTAFHHHDDGADHDDCPVCSASLHHSPADFATSVPVIHREFAKIEFFTPTPPAIVTAVSTPSNSRAPPV